MALAIKKKEKTGLSLKKPVQTVAVKMNWDPNGTDLDLLAIGIRKGQKAREEDVLFWGTETENAKGQKEVGGESIVFTTGDNRTGDGDDDEVMVLKAVGSQYDAIEIYSYVYPPDGDGSSTLDEAKNAKLEFFLNGASAPSHFFNFSDDKYFGVKGIQVGVISLDKAGYPEFESSDLEFSDGLEGIFAHHNFATE